MCYICLLIRRVLEQLLFVVMFCNISKKLWFFMHSMTFSYVGYKKCQQMDIMNEYILLHAIELELLID